MGRTAGRGSRGARQREGGGERNRRRHSSATDCKQSKVTNCKAAQQANKLQGGKLQGQGRTCRAASAAPRARGVGAPSSVRHSMRTTLEWQSAACSAVGGGSKLGAGRACLHFFPTDEQGNEWSRMWTDHPAVARSASCRIADHKPALTCTASSFDPASSSRKRPAEACPSKMPLYMSWMTLAVPPGEDRISALLAGQEGCATGGGRRVQHAVMLHSTACLHSTAWPRGRRRRLPK